MTEFERRNFLIWAAGSAFTFLTIGAAAAHADLEAEQGQGKKPADPKGGTTTKPASKPAADPKANDKKKEVEAGEQTDGSYVLDPDNPPKLDVKTKESPNGTFVKVGSTTVLVAQSEDKKKWHAVNAICPHKACALSFKGEEFRCPCHGSKFSLAGKVAKGPAKDDLTVFKVEEVKGKGGKKFVKISKE